MTTENVTLNIETGPTHRVVPVKNKHEVNLNIKTRNILFFSTTNSMRKKTHKHASKWNFLHAYG